MKIPYSKVDCSGNELNYVREVLESGWLTTASKTFEFEEKFAELVGARYACAVNSGTAALHLALEAAGMAPGERVFVPAMTFTASAEIVRYLGGDPVFLDIEFGSSLVTSEILEAAMREHPDVKYLVIVHFGGQSARMLANENGTGIKEICGRYGIKIIEDAAHAFPSRCQGRMVGSWGNPTAYSFYANKTITTGEGGMVVTDDKAVYERMKVMRLHGINKDIWARYGKSMGKWEYDVVDAGFKYNMPDIAAAVGLAQLERAFEMRAGRERCARYYLERLGNLESLVMPKLHCAMDEHSWHIFQIILGDDCKIGRNELIERLAEAGIGISVHYKPLYRMSYYRDRYHTDPSEFPNTERTWRGCLSLPVYPGLSEKELDYVCGKVEEIVDGRL